MIIKEKVKKAVFLTEHLFVVRIYGIMVQVTNRLLLFSCNRTIFGPVFLTCVCLQR